MPDAPRQEDGAREAAPPERSGESSAAAAESFGEVWRRLGPTRWLGILWATAPALCGIALLTFLGPISDWLLAHREAGLFAYTILFAVSAGFGLLPTYAQSILGGWVFGFWLGWGAAMVGFTAAAIIGYFVARMASHNRVENLVETHAKARVIREALIGHGFARTLAIVTLIRVPPNSPFALTNLLLATTGVRLLPYALGTAIGMAPRTALAAWLAASWQSEGARDIQELVREGYKGLGVWYFIGGLIVMFLVLGVIGAIANRALERVAAPPAPAGAADPPSTASARK